MVQSLPLGQPQWSLLGAVEPRLNWQLLGLVSDVETFRVTHRFSGTVPYRLHGYIGQFFLGGNQVANVRKIWPTPEAQILELRIPYEFRLNNVLSRNIAVKLATPRHLGLTNFDWNVTVEVGTIAKRPNLAAGFPPFF